MLVVEGLSRNVCDEKETSWCDAQGSRCPLTSSRGGFFLRIEPDFNCGEVLALTLLLARIPIPPISEATTTEEGSELPAAADAPTLVDGAPADADCQAT